MTFLDHLLKINISGEEYIDRQRNRTLLFVNYSAAVLSAVILIVEVWLRGRGLRTVDAQSALFIIIAVIISTVTLRYRNYRIAAHISVASIFIAICALNLEKLHIPNTKSETAYLLPLLLLPSFLLGTVWSIIYGTLSAALVIFMAYNIRDTSTDPFGYAIDYLAAIFFSIVFSGAVSAVYTEALKLARQTLVRLDHVATQLKSINERLQSIIDEAPAMIIIYDRRGTILSANQTFLQFTGYSPPEVEGKTIFDCIVIGDDVQMMQNVLDRVFHGETVRNTEWASCSKSGRRLYALVTIVPLYDASRQVESALALGVDITDRKLSEQRTAELETHKREFYRKTIESVTQGKLLIVDRSEICKIAGKPIRTWELTDARDITDTRQEIAALCRELGMEASILQDFVLCIGEAVTNAVKHAHGGNLSLHKIDSSLMAVVSDRGPGIDALTLPEATLSKGYSSASSMGMGYKMIITIADTVYLATSQLGTTVGIQMRLMNTPEEIKIPDLQNW